MSESKTLKYLSRKKCSVFLILIYSLYKNSQHFNRYVYNFNVNTVIDNKQIIYSNNIKYNLSILSHIYDKIDKVKGKISAEAYFSLFSE